MVDAATMAGLHIGNVTLELSHSSAAGRIRPDILVVSVDNIPLLIVDVKSWRESHILDDPKVKGQLYDYLLSARVNFGARPLGMLTDVGRWRFGWLQSESELVVGGSESAGVTNTEDRILCVSPIYECTDANLVRRIVTAIRKSASAPKARISLIDRSLVTFDAATWLWGKWVDYSKDLRTADFSLCFAYYKESNFHYVLRMATSSPRHCVFIGVPQCLRKGVVPVVVYKLMRPMEGKDGRWQYDPGLEASAVERQHAEYQRWLFFWGVRAVKLKVYTLPALALPFVLTARDAHTFPTTAEGIAALLLGPAAHESDISALQPLALKLQQAVESDGWSPSEALQQATNVMAQKGFVHTDLQWRHVGLLPEFDTSSGAIVSMKPVLIDLEYVSSLDISAESAAAAERREQMLAEAAAGLDPTA
jgi:hypothetical protein